MLNLYWIRSRTLITIGSFAMVNFLLGQQSGYTNFPYSLCQWDSKDDINHWQRKEWPIPERLVVGQKKCYSGAIIKQRLHHFSSPKPGLMKHFVKALDRSGECFCILREHCPVSVEKKLKQESSMDRRLDS